jgi:diguanylate cyclase (GGDEF)-like protein
MRALPETRDLTCAGAQEIAAFIVVCLVQMMITTDSAQAYAGDERRDHLTRKQRDVLANWLELHPRALAQVPHQAIGALELSREATRAADARIRRLRRLTHVLEHRVGVLEQQTLSDPLTGVASRRALEARLRHECALLRRSGQPFAVFLLDADNLKEVNDSLGHASGDDYLREVAGRLVMTVRDMDLVARLGGDEFVLVCPGATQETASELAERLAESLSGVFDAGAQQEVSMSVSIGWVVAEPGSTVEDLLRRADVTMYHAKAGHKRGGAAGSLPGQAVPRT